MKRPSSVILAAILLDLIFVVPNGGIGLTQGPQDQPDLTLHAATRAEVIEGVLKSLNDSYVFPDVAKQMEKSVRAAAKERIRRYQQCQGVCQDAD